MSTEKLLKLFQTAQSQWSDGGASAASAGREDRDYRAKRADEMVRDDTQIYEDYTPDHLVSKPSQYNILAFDSIIDFALYFHPALSSFTTFHEWQSWALLLSTHKQWSGACPLELYLVASNGSGKDSYFIAILSLYLLCCKKRNKIVITTSDGKQMYNQTFPAMKSFAEAINKKLKDEGFATEDFIDVKFGEISSNQTGGIIHAFVTDDAGRAEGYHPFADEIESELTLIINEAKTVKAEIFQAFRRCNPYTRYLCVSSTGTDSGYFYEHAVKAITYPAPVDPKKPYTRYITSYDCPHVSRELIERDERELEPWLFDSIHRSRFSSMDGLFCIPSYIVTNNKFSKESEDAKEFDDYAVGLDLSMGGDEVAMITRKGPWIIDEYFFREKTAALVKANILANLEKLELPEGIPIFSDVGGPGKPIISDLRDTRSEYQWIEIANQSAARNNRLYLNTGAEDYFHVRALLEKGRIPSPSLDSKLGKQLVGRRFALHKGRYRLEEKKEARARGEQSPDRSDAYVLAFRRFRVSYNATADKEKNPDSLMAEKLLIRSSDPKVEEKLLEALNTREFKTRKVAGGRSLSPSHAYYKLIR